MGYLEETMSQDVSRRDACHAKAHSLLLTGGITLSEFNEIYMAIETVFLGRCPATVCRNVAEFFESMGIAVAVRDSEWLINAYK